MKALVLSLVILAPALARADVFPGCGPDMPDITDLAEPPDMQVPDLARPRDLDQGMIGRRHRPGGRVGAGLVLIGSCLGVYLSQRRRRS